MHLSILNFTWKTAQGEIQMLEISLTEKRNQGLFMRYGRNPNALGHACLNHLILYLDTWVANHLIFAYLKTSG